MKMQKSVIFLKKKLKIYIWKISFTVPIEKEFTRIDENGEEITKIYLTYYNLLIAQDLW